MQFHVEQDENQVVLRSAFNPHTAQVCRARGGKWDGIAKAWRWSGGAMANALTAIALLFGESKETVTVRVPASHPSAAENSDWGAVLHIGGYVLAQRRGRDETAHVGDEVALVAGTLPQSGGSVKHPRVNPSSDAVFELEMRRDFAERMELIAPEVAPDPVLCSPQADRLQQVRNRIRDLNLLIDRTQEQIELLYAEEQQLVGELGNAGTMEGV